MALPKNFKGFLAVMVVTFMVATALVPAVNVHAGPADGPSVPAADAGSPLEGSDDPSGPIGAGDLPSFLRDLLEQAGVPQLSELAGDLDINAVVDAFRSADSSSVLSALFSGAFTGGSGDSGWIERIIEWFEEIKDYIGTLFSDSRSIYIPYITYWGFELQGVSLDLEFKNGKFASASADIASIRSEESRIPFGLEDVSVHVGTGGFEVFLGYLLFNGNTYDVSADLSFQDDKYGYTAALEFRDLISVVYTKDRSGGDVNDEVDVAIPELSVPWGNGTAVVSDFRLSFFMGSEQLFYAEAHSVTCGGEDITEEFNTCIGDFIRNGGDYTVELDELQFGLLHMKGVTIGFESNVDLHSLAVTLDCQSFDVGGYGDICGDGLNFSAQGGQWEPDGQASMVVHGVVGKVDFKNGQEEQELPVVSLEKIVVGLHVHGQAFLMNASVDDITAVLENGQVTVRCGTSESIAFALAYVGNGLKRSLVAAIGNTEVETAIGPVHSVRHIPQVHLKGDIIPQADDTGIRSAKFEMFTEDENSDCDNYASLVLKNVGAGETFDVSVERFDGIFTYIGKVSSDPAISPDPVVTAGIGIGRSPNLGGNDIFTVHATFGAESAIGIGYDFPGDGGQSWNASFAVADNGSFVTLTGEKVEWGEGISADRMEINVELNTSSFSFSFVADDLILGQEDYIMRAGSLSMGHQMDVPAGTEKWYFMADNIILGGDKVSDTFLWVANIDKDGHYEQQADGDLDAEFEGLYINGIYVDGTASAVEGTLQADIDFSDGSNGPIGDLTSDEDSFEFSINGADVGPLTGFSSHLSLAAGEKVNTFSVSRIDLAENTTKKCYMMGVGLDEDGRFAIGSIMLGETGSDPERQVVCVEEFVVCLQQENGFVIEASSIIFDAEYADPVTPETVSSLQVVMGEPSGEHKAVEIKNVAESGKVFTDFVFNVQNAEFKFAGDDVDVDVKSSGPASGFACYHFVENETGEVVQREITGMSATMSASNETGVIIAFVGSNLDLSVTYGDGDVTVDRLQMECFNVIGYHTLTSFENISKDAETEGRYPIERVSFETADGEEKIVCAPAEIIAGDEITLRLPQVELETEQAGCTFSATGVRFVFSAGSYLPDVYAETAEATLENYVFEPTGSVINCHLRYERLKPAGTSIELNVSRIAPAQIPDLVIKGLDYLYKAGRSGHTQQNILKYASLSTPSGLKTGEAMFDLHGNSYSIKDLEYSYSSITGREVEASIGFIRYSDASSSLPEVDFAIGETDIYVKTLRSEMLFSSTGFEFSAGFGPNGMYSVTADGDFTYSHETKHVLYVSLEGFAAVFTPDTEHGGWNIEMGQDGAVISYSTMSGGLPYTLGLSSTDSFTGRLTVSGEKAIIEGDYSLDQTHYVAYQAEETRIKYAGTGGLRVAVPLQSGMQFSDISLEFSCTIDEIVVIDGGEEVRADLRDASFGVSIEAEDGITDIEVSVEADLSLDVLGSQITVDGLSALLTVSDDESALFNSDISLDLDCDGFSVRLPDGVHVEMEDIFSDDMGIVIGQALIIDDGDDQNLVFENLVFDGVSFVAESMSGHVGGEDILQLEYDASKKFGERIDAYRGLAYFNFRDGLVMFKSSERVEPPRGLSIVFSSPTYEMVFIENPEQPEVYESYYVPVGQTVELGDYYDIMPMLSIDAGIPMTTDCYPVQPFDVELTPACTLRDMIDALGFIRLERGAGVVYDSVMVDELDVGTVTLVTPQDVTLEISTDALRKMQDGVDRTVISISMDSARNWQPFIKGFIDRLSDDNREVVLDGWFLLVNTGHDDTVRDLGKIRITIPVDVVPEQGAPYTAYRMQNQVASYIDTCSYSTDHGQGYLTLNTNQLSDFVICGELNYAPSVHSAYVICGAIIVMGLIVAAYCIHRRHSI